MHFKGIEIDLEDDFYKIFKKANFKAKKKHIREIAMFYQILTTKSLGLDADIVPIIDYCIDHDIELYTIAKGQSREVYHELKAVNLDQYIMEVVSTTSDKKSVSKLLEKLMKDRNLKKKDTLFIGKVLKDDIDIAKDLGIQTALIGGSSDKVNISGSGEEILKYVKKS